MTAYLRPDPRVRLGVWLGRNRTATACIDLSDGLADGVKRRRQRSVLAAARHSGVPLTRIGVCNDGRAVVLRRARIEMPLPLAGYDHFGATASASPVHE